MKVRSDYVPHQIHLTTAQIKKLGSGLSTNLKHSQMGADKGDIVVMLRPQNARKMLTSYKKSKGMRLSLSPDEIEETMKEGGGFFKTLKKWTGIGKTQFLGEAKKIGKEVVNKGAMVVGEAIGAYTGNPVAGHALGMALSKAGDKTIDSIQPSKGKLGIKFDPKSGIKSLKDDAKMYAVETIDRQIDKLPPEQRRVAEKALAGQYPDASSFIYDASTAMSGLGLYGGRVKKGSPEAKARMAMLRAKKAGGKINIGKAFKKLGHDIESGAKTAVRTIDKEVIRPAGKALASKDAMSVYKAIGKHAIEQGIPIATALGSMALGDPTGMSGAMVGNIAQQYASKAYSDKVGTGRPRGRPRKQGGALAMMSKPYKQALKLNKATYGLEVGGFSSENNAPISNFSTNPRVRPSSNEMTLSPYQNITSPAMNPFVPTTYRQEGGTSCGYGGRGLYAGGLF